MSSDKTSCACPRCWPELHIDQCGDINCTGQCRSEDDSATE